MKTRIEPRMKPEKESNSSTCAVRSCVQCGYQVADMMVARCPRCWGPLPPVSCGACRSCPMGKG